jgi:Mrp family chromosome partitioning ATPase
VRLERERKLHGAKIFVVAGAGHGVGATSVALSLADTLSTFLPRVLFLEVLPSISPKAVSLKEDAENLSLALQNIEEWMASKAGRKGLSLLAAHEKEVPLPSQIRQLLSLARETFDIVVINTPPPGFHDFAQFILLEVDAAVVVVREDKTLYKELVATLEVLRERPVAALTAILNFSTRHKSFDRAFLTDKCITGVSRFCTSFRKRILCRLPWSR